MEDLGAEACTSEGLLEKAEEADLILSHEQDLVEKLEMEFVSYPIRDRTVPLELSSFITLVHGIVARVRNGQGVAVHCLGGIGRSGVTVASAMVALGADVETIFQHISQARGIDVPDTDEQAAWFEEHHPSFRLDV